VDKKILNACITTVETLQSEVFQLPKVAACVLDIRVDVAALSGGMPLDWNRRGITRTHDLLPELIDAVALSLCYPSRHEVTPAAGNRYSLSCTLALGSSDSG
jgi:hypothetical protein